MATTSQYRWQCLTRAAPFAPRDGAGLLSWRGRLWLLGGWNPHDQTHFPRTCSNDVWSSVDGVEWQLERPNTFVDASFDARADWEGRHTAGYAVHQDSLWIVGGDPLQGHYQSDVWRSADGADWERVDGGQGAPWGPRALHYTVAFDESIWVLGGQTTPQFAPAAETFHRDVWRTRDGRTWEQLTPQSPWWPARGMIGGSAVLHGRLWLLGGGTYDTPGRPQRQYFSDVWSTADGVAWTRHTDAAAWAPRQYHEVAAFDGRLWVLEGYAGANRNDVWHSADGVHWQELPDTPWAPRHAASVCVHQDALWVIAGNNMESDVWRLVRG